MSTLGSTPQKPDHTNLLESLIDSRRRRTLSILGDRGTFVTERELAAQLAAIEQEETVSTVSPEEIRTVRISLRHVHLPKLSDLDLVTWDETDETVTATDHPVHDNTQFQQLLEREDASWDTLVTILANERRRIVLAVLESRSGPWARADLARAVASREADGEPSTEAIDEVTTQLHHVHLPKLDQAELVEYDVNDGTLVSRDHPELPKLEALNL